jgi:hypothetical protein
MLGQPMTAFIIPRTVPFSLGDHVKVRAAAFQSSCKIKYEKFGVLNQWKGGRAVGLPVLLPGCQCRHLQNTDSGKSTADAKFDHSWLIGVRCHARYVRDIGVKASSPCIAKWEKTFQGQLIAARA